MDVTVQLVGFKELAEALKDLPDNISKNVLRSAVGAGAAEIRKQAKANAEAMRDTGTLARSIYQKQIREQSNVGKQVFYVGARQGKSYQKVGKKGVSQDAYYARYVELGHFSRRTTKGFERVSRNANRGGVNNQRLADQVQAGTVKWVPAKPFLRPAFDVKKESAIQAMAKKIAERLVKIKVGK
jgi:HK97 gp10 family phage protein